MLNEQGGGCAICGNEVGHISKFGKDARLAIDHCHKTGKIRGLLCNNCNRGLGNFQDNIILLQKAVNYLQKDKGL